MNKWLVKKGEYTFDRRIFIWCLASLGFMFVVVVALVGFKNHVYLSCPADARGPCLNPYYDGEMCMVDDEELCNLPRVMMPGDSFGEKPPWLATQSNFGFCAWVLVVVAFVVNHFVHNRRFGLWNKLFSKP